MKQKQKKIVPLGDWESVDAGLHKLAHVQIEIDRLQADFSEEIQRLNTQYDDKISPLLEAASAIKRQLEGFVKDHRLDLKGKSRILNFGIVGFRTSQTKVIFKWTVENILQALRVRKLSDCIRIKEEPNKEALELLTDAALEAVGCRKSGGKEKFYAEPDLEKIVERP
jgi:phage host-nuclease inhibitor protein Gam